jgi:hypothetical protein
MRVAILADIHGNWTAKFKYLLLDLERSRIQFTQRSVPFCREAAVQEMRAGFREDPGPNVWLARWLGLSPEMENEWRPPFEELTWHWSRPR